MIKSKLIPFVNKHHLSFWITNYWNQSEDYILFRVKGNTAQFKLVEDLLNDLISGNLIVRHIPSPWNPKSDAEKRIDDLIKINNFDPKTQRIEEYSNNTLHVYPDSNIHERKEQLTALYESLGECTRTIYNHLKIKPNDKWIMSLFIHLLLNSMDYSGPDQLSEEYNIRRIPVY